MNEHNPDQQKQRTLRWSRRSRRRDRRGRVRGPNGGAAFDLRSGRSQGLPTPPQCVAPARVHPRDTTSQTTIAEFLHSRGLVPSPPSEEHLLRLLGAMRSAQIRLLNLPELGAPQLLELLEVAVLPMEAPHASAGPITFDLTSLDPTDPSRPEALLPRRRASAPDTER